jgi:hypothetical protein
LTEKGMKQAEKTQAMVRLHAPFTLSSAVFRARHAVAVSVPNDPGLGPLLPST